MTDMGRIQVGHPVDVGSGAVFTAMEDFALPGTLQLGWDRFYSSDLAVNSWLGRGWIVPWFMSLERVDLGYVLLDERGRSLLFPITDSADLPVGGCVVSYGANMALLRRDGYFVVEHWHHGTDDVEWFWFQAVLDRAMPLAMVENIHGHRIHVQHDEKGRPARLIQEIERRVLELTYGRSDLLDTIWLLGGQGARSRLASYEYDDDRRLTLAFDAMGHCTTYVYDAEHRMLRETNALGSSFHFKYDARGRCIHTYGDGGYMERKLQHLSAPRATRVTDGFGNITTYLLNTVGQVIQEISPLGATKTTEFDEYGRPISILHATGSILRYEYDADGNRSAVVHEDGGRSEMTYNDSHLLHEYKSPSGATWIYDFNTRGEVTGLINPLGERHSATRDGRGLVIETSSPTGVTVTRRYGSTLQWVEAADAISLLTRTEYDDRGNQTAIFDAQGLVQRITYDALGRPVAAEDRVGRRYRMAWNALGEMTELSGPDVAWEQRTYDGFGQLVEHTNALGVLRVYYDKEGRITRIVNRTNEELTWAYDADGWLVRETGFDGRTEHYKYDLAGRAVNRIMSDERSISQTFDVLGQVIRRVSSDGEIAEFAYDTDGWLVKAKNPFAEVLLERNLAGRVTAEVQNGRRIEYTHDADGDRVGRRIVGPGSKQLTFRRDARKRLTSLADELGSCLDQRWDDVNRPIERRFVDRITERLAYDPLGRLCKQSVSSSQPGAQVERQYEYDNRDDLVERRDLNFGRSTFSYDEIGRITKVSSGGSVAESYAYDANGAILETHRGRRVVAAGGRTLEEGSRHCSYGLDGCLQTISVDGRITQIEHNVDGQVTKAELPDGRIVKYEYDPLGRRTAKEMDGLRTEFVWDGPVLAAEYINGELSDSFYVFGFEPLLQWRKGKRIFAVKDQSGMVREAFDDSGSLLWHGNFETYGALVSESGLRTSPFGFRGQYIDRETDLHYNFFRSYSPVLGDYTAPDPIGIEGGTHFYAYPRNPLQCDDPFGLKCGTAKCGEKSMDGYYGQKGYKKVGAIGKNPNANGIDAIYYNPNKKPPYIIAEAKNRGGYLHTDQHGNAQMSDAWINSPAGNASKKRLDAAFPPGSPHPAAIRAAANGDVHTTVYNPEATPKVTNYGTYGGASSPNPNAPPVNTDPTR